MEKIIYGTLLILPIIILIIGLYFRTNPPKEINNTVGYRTTASKSSKEAWDYANAKSADYMVKYGIGSLIVTIAVVAILCIKCTDISPTVIVVVTTIGMLLQTVGLLVVIPIVESGLKNLNI